MEVSIVGDDRTPVAELTKRYQIGRTQLYEKRLAAMSRAGLGEPIKIQNKAYVTAEQLKFLDALDKWIGENGSDVDRFLAERYGLHSDDGQKSSALATTREAMPESREALLLEILSATVQQISRTQANTLNNFEQLERAYQNRWHLPTHKLSELLDLKTLKGDTIERYGFKCTRLESRGRESEWLIEKIAR